MKRVVIIVIDGFGVGALPDADSYNDAGSHTLDNTARAVGGLNIEILASMGLGLIQGVNEVKKVSKPVASYGRMMEKSPGKDTTTGHWEITGVVLTRPFPTFPGGFPFAMLEDFSLKTGRGWLWGKPASGTEIIERLGTEHLKTGKLIVYTSADSVFQIAAHVDVIGEKELYRICEISRKLCDGYNVCRVIARPFEGKPGGFKRTAGRKDFSVPPPDATLLDTLKEAGLQVVGIGKVPDIFTHRGFTREIAASGNSSIVEGVKEALKDTASGLIFANLVDFDMLYGHRNDFRGYARALEEFDRMAAGITDILKDDDIFIITADHGCDPTTLSTDHSREYAPVIVYGKRLKPGVNLGTRESFSDIAQTIASYFNVRKLKNGTGFLRELTAG